MSRRRLNILFIFYKKRSHVNLASNILLNEAIKFLKLDTLWSKASSLSHEIKYHLYFFSIAVKCELLNDMKFSIQIVQIGEDCIWKDASLQKRKFLTLICQMVLCISLGTKSTEVTSAQNVLVFLVHTYHSVQSEAQQHKSKPMLWEIWTLLGLYHLWL